MDSYNYQVRDPIHGVIYISSAERAVIDSPVFQRLRHIKQVGFVEFAFPCAGHSRYCHSLGAMSFASRIFRKVINENQMGQQDWQRLFQAVRLAALLHDIGHPPLSHTTEMIMPFLGERRATHEDYTLRLILDSPISSLIVENFKDIGVTPLTVSSLLNELSEEDYFIINGVSYTTILRQIISSEIDADRMDYLLRDSFFCGVNYGKFDYDWLIENLTSIHHQNKVYLGIKERAIFAFEDFLLSRYHMFSSVYLHHTPIILEKMLERFFTECPESFSLPWDLEKYVALQDTDLWQALRASNNPWAVRVVNRKPFAMVHEQISHLETNAAKQSFHSHLVAQLSDQKIDFITSRSTSVLSKYYNKIKSPLFVENSQHKHIPLEEFSSLFIKYQGPTEIMRIYVDPKTLTLAKKLIQNI